MRALFVLVALGGCTAAQLQTAAVDGQLYCAKATAAGPLVVALANAAAPGSPGISVIGKASSAVAYACSKWDAAAEPVAPPATAVPTVAVKLPAA